ncbi:Putative fimbrial chaperone, partial [Salmonella enterica subsp. enterica serovar Senftenberg str. A4-543]
RPDGRTMLVNTTPYIYAIGSLLDANGKKVAVDNDTAQKLLMFMPGDEVQVKGNVVKVDSLNDYGELQTWTINQKKAATSSAQKTSDTPVNSPDKADKK